MDRLCVCGGGGGMEGQRVVDLIRGCVPGALQALSLYGNVCVLPEPVVSTAGVQEARLVMSARLPAAANCHNLSSSPHIAG